MRGSPSQPVGSNPNTPPAIPEENGGLSLTLSGDIMAGPVIKPMTVTAYDAQGKELGSTTTDSKTPGSYTLSIASSKQFMGGAVVLRVTDPTQADADKGNKDFIDEATGQAKNLPDLRALIHVDSNSTTKNGTVSAHITPLTTLAAERLMPSDGTSHGTLPSSLTAADIQTNNQQVGMLFGLRAGTQSDVTQVKPEAVIDANNAANPNSNWYGKALAVLSFAQASNDALDAVNLAKLLPPFSNNPDAAPLSFSNTLAEQFQTASLKAVQKNYLSTVEANAIQSSTAGSTKHAIDFRFLSDSVTVGGDGKLDPAHALGQPVYELKQLTSSPTSSNTATQALVNVNTAQLRFQLTGADAAAFAFDADTGRLTLLDNQASIVQAKGGKTYHLGLQATADVLDTLDDPTDDISITQQLTITVVDNQPPTQPNSFTLNFKAIEGLQTTAGLTTVGRPAALHAQGFLELTDVDAGSLAPGVRHQVHITFTNTADSTGSKRVTRTWDDWLAADATHTIGLSDSELATLGDGRIQVSVQVKAIDLADNASASVVQTTQFQLDTTVTQPRVTMLTNVATPTDVNPISGDGKIRINDIEPGAQWFYRLDGDADVVTGGAVVQGQATLDLSSLGTGPHTIAVYQRDGLGNVSATRTVTFELKLESPTGVDAQIDQFAFFQVDDPTVQVGANSQLFHTQGIDVPFKITGLVRGTLEAGERLQFGVNGANWQNIQLDADLNAVGQSTWSFQPSLPMGSGWLSVRLVDTYQHGTILTTRNYVFQEDSVLRPPTPAWLGTASVEALSGQSTPLMRVTVGGLSPHAIAQYQVGSSSSMTLEEDKWSNTIPQPSDDGTYYLFVRQLDMLTGRASAAAEPLVVEVDTAAPNAIASTPNGLYFQPVDGAGGSSTLTSATLADDTLIENTEWHQARTVVVYNRWSDLDVGGTLFMRWGNVLKTHVLTNEDISAGTVYIEWSQADIQNQPGLVSLQAWTTDPTGQTSSVATRQWTVNTAAVGAPKVLGWYTRTSADSAVVSDIDGTINRQEATNGVVLKLQLPLTQTNGSTPLNWANNSQGYAFKLNVLAKSPTQAWSSDQIVTTRSFALSEMDANGVVQWVLPSSITSALWGGLDGALRDVKVQVQNNAYVASSPLRLSETPLSQLIVDVTAPSAVSLLVSAGAQNTATLGLNQQELAVTVGYAGMTAGDVLVFRSQVTGGSGQTTVHTYRLKASDITRINGWSTAVVRLARESITQGRSDGSYDLSVDITDPAGNTTAWTTGTKPRVVVDTLRPSAPTLSVASQDLYLNASEDQIDITVTWPGNTRVSTDQVKWVIGGADFTRATLVSTTASSATYRFLKSDLGQEGVKDLRANLTDASGNLGDYSVALRVVLDSQPHDPPVVKLHDASGNQRFLKAGSTVQLDVSSTQMVVGDKVQWYLSTNAADPVGSRISLGDSITVDHALQHTVTLSQSADQAHWGLAGLASGEYRVTATVTDLAGNVSQRATDYHLVVDLDAPTNRATPGSVQLSSHALVDATAVEGHHRDFITGVANQVITVQLSTALQAASHLMGAEFVWARVLTPGLAADTGWVNVSAGVSGTTLSWDTATTGGLADGVNTLQFQVRDQAGNRGVITEQIYVLDRTAPTNAIQAGSLHFSQDSAPTGASAGVLGSDFKTRQAGQTITLDLTRALMQDAINSPTWGAGQEHLWASLDNGATWNDISDKVDAAGHLVWSGVTLTHSSTARFKVMDVAGNAGVEFSQAYVLDQSAPTTSVAALRFIDDTGVDNATHQDFVTASATTAISLTFNHVLAAGERVYVRMGAGETPLDITDSLRAQGLADSASFASAGGIFTSDEFALLTGAHTVSVWVEDEVGNVGTMLQQDYVYAPAAPSLDLDGLSAATGWSTTVGTALAQHGVALGRDIQVQNLPAGVAQIILTFDAIDNSNGSSERLLITPGVDINLAGVSDAPVSGLRIDGIAGTVQLHPWGGSYLTISKTDVAGGTAYFTSTEVSTLLNGLRYFNSESADLIETGTRLFSVQLIDRATNESNTQTARLALTTANAVEGRDASAGADHLTGTAGDDILLGLQGDDMLSGGVGNDVMWGGGTNPRVDPGNNTFLWSSGDATSGTQAHRAIDLIRDFRAWNGSSGDRLDITRLLEGYSASQESALGNWVQVDNNATVQGVARSTRLTIDVNGSQAGGDVQIIELQGVQLSSSSALDLVHTQLLKVL